MRRNASSQIGRRHARRRLHYNTGLSIQRCGGCPAVVKMANDLHDARHRVGGACNCWNERKGGRMAGRNGSNGSGDEDGKTGLITKTRPKTKKPSLYKVLLLNDDYTPMEFVVHVLERFFNKGREDATRIMLHVHHKGVGICGVYTYEVAETKVAQVMDFSRQHQHPLQCTMEKE
jgi:ATP-dependent Clp protease adaptor protein ClpS